MSDRTGEFNSTDKGDGQNLTQPAVTVPLEQIVEISNPLPRRLAEVRTTARTHIEKARSLLEWRVSEPDQEKHISPEDVKKQLEELKENTTVEPPEYLSKSMQTLTASAQVREKLQGELKTLDDSLNHLITDGWRIDAKIDQLDQVRGLKWIPATLKRRQLSAQKATKDADIKIVTGRKNALIQFVDELTKLEISVLRKRDKVLLEELGSEVRTVREEYEKLFQEIIQDGTIAREIREAYIRSVIAPIVDKIAQEKQYPDDQKQGFYTALQNYFDHGDESQDQKQSHLQKLDTYFSYENGFPDVRDVCNTLLRGGDKQIIQSLVANIAAADIARIKATIEPNLNNDQKSIFSTVFNKAVEPSDRWSRDEHSFGSQVLSKLDQYNSGSAYEHMDLWNALKSSKVAMELFDGATRERDVEMYTTALDKSLSDTTKGGYIDMLYHYPTPDAIRNLVLIASADNQGFLTTRANSTLDSLSKRPEWGRLLDEAEKTYPSLRGAREVLEKWSYQGIGNQPNIKIAAGGLAVTVFEGDKVNTRLTTLAMHSLTTDAIVNILVKRKVLSELETQSIGQAIVFLREIDNKTSTFGDIFFNRGLSENLLSFLQPEEKDAESLRRTVVQRFEALSKKILENKEDLTILTYLTSNDVVNRVKDPSTSIENLPAFLDAYKTCPELLRNSDLRSEFCRQYEGEQSAVFFRDIASAYQGLKDQLNPILSLVGNKVLSQERVLELPTVARDVLESPHFYLALEFPRLFLETSDGVEFFTQTSSGSLFTLGEHLDTRIGERIRALQGNDNLEFSKLFNYLASNELKQLDKILLSEPPNEASKLRWPQLLVAYAAANSEVLGRPKLSDVSKQRINTLFNDLKTRDACLNGLRDHWVTYLKSGKTDKIPFSLILVSEFINNYGGAGPLSQINSLNTLVSSVNYAFSRETTTDRTKLEISQGLVSMDERFAREKWSNESKSDFYHISRDIMNAAPSLFSDYLSLFRKFSPSQLKQFSKDLYPLYKTKLVLMEKKNDEGATSFGKDQLIEIRRDIRDFAMIFDSGEGAFDAQKTKLLGEITGMFKERFGIIKIPETFTSEHMRSFTNVSAYLANLHGRTPEKETVLGYYLSMMVNDQWDDFRKGVEANPDELLIPEKSAHIKRFLLERQRLNPLTAENLGLSPEEMPELLRLLQQETSNVVIGNIETIDVKLSNIVLNLRGLEDLDLYTDQLDKRRMGLLLEHGNKKIGSIVARMYQQLANPAKVVRFTEEEEQIQAKITQVMQESGLSLSPQKLSECFQEGIKPLSTVVNLISFVEESKAEQEVSSLRGLLKPSSEIIEIFKRLGEDFKPTSGALALSQDLSYLDNLIVKREEEITPEEKAILVNYTSQIREQVVKLEEIYGQIKSKMGGLRQGNTMTTNPLLKEKLDQIDRIINAQTTQQVITSTATNNLNTIIENIRECLSCTKEGCNNDTDLTFGDINKFYLYSQTETQKRGSISDELVFVEPITRADGSQGMAFVLDRIYGTNTPTVLENQIDVILKKQRAIKLRFPGIKLSVFVSEAAIKTGGTSADILLEKFKTESIAGQIESVEVNVVESATGDHYVEFGGSARTAGKRQVKGILLAA